MSNYKKALLTFICSFSYLHGGGSISKKKANLPDWLPLLPLELLNEISHFLPSNKTQTNEEFKKELQAKKIESFQELVKTVKSPDGSLQGESHYFNGKDGSFILFNKKNNTSKKLSFAHFAGQMFYSTPIALSNTGHIAVYDGRLNQLILVHNTQDGEINLGKQKHVLPIEHQVKGFLICLFFNKQTTQVGARLKAVNNKEEIVMFDLPEPFKNSAPPQKTMEQYFKQKLVCSRYPQSQ